MAIDKKLALSVGRQGKPKDILLAPQVKFTPRVFRIRRIVSKVTNAAWSSALTVNTKGSISK